MIHSRETIRRGQGSVFAAILLALALTVAGAISPAASSADVGMQIVERCGHSQSIAGYTVKQYRRALQEMETEVIEYSDCAELINKAELAAASAHRSIHTGDGPSSGTGGSLGSGVGGEVSGGQAVEPTPAEQKTLEAVRDRSASPVRLAGNGETVLPGVVHPNLASATSDLPTPVLVMIALVLAGLLLLACLEIRKRVGGRPQG